MQPISFLPQVPASTLLWSSHNPAFVKIQADGVLTLPMHLREVLQEHDCQQNVMILAPLLVVDLHIDIACFHQAGVHIPHFIRHSTTSNCLKAAISNSDNNLFKMITQPGDTSTIEKCREFLNRFNVDFDTEQFTSMVLDVLLSRNHNAQNMWNMLEECLKGTMYTNKSDVDLDRLLHYITKQTTENLLNVINVDDKFDQDVVPCIHVSDWPESARNWPRTERCWPSPELVQHIQQQGVHLVRKAAYSGDPHMDWRISFSIAEKFLLCNMNPCQKKCSLGLKLLQNQYLNVEKGLTSYHMKTVTLWSCEKYSPQVCETSGNLGPTISSMLSVLKICLEKRMMEHYFIPEVNLLANIPERTINEVLKNLKYVCDNLHTIESSINQREIEIIKLHVERKCVNEIFIHFSKRFQSRSELPEHNINTYIFNRQTKLYISMSFAVLVVCFAWRYASGTLSFQLGLTALLLLTPYFLNNAYFILLAPVLVSCLMAQNSKQFVYDSCYGIIYISFLNILIPWHSPLDMTPYHKTGIRHYLNMLLSQPFLRFFFIHILSNSFDQWLILVIHLLAISNNYRLISCLFLCLSVSIEPWFGHHWSSSISYILCHNVFISLRTHANKIYVICHWQVACATSFREDIGVQ